MDDLWCDIFHRYKTENTPALGRPKDISILRNKSPRRTLGPSISCQSAIYSQRSCPIPKLTLQSFPWSIIMRITPAIGICASHSPDIDLPTLWSPSAGRFDVHGNPAFEGDQSKRELFPALPSRRLPKKPLDDARILNGTTAQTTNETSMRIGSDAPFCVFRWTQRTSYESILEPLEPNIKIGSPRRNKKIFCVCEVVRTQSALTQIDESHIPVHGVFASARRSRSTFLSNV
jgi:hypothetical protein